MTEAVQYDMVKEIAKKKILSILAPNLELNGDIYIVKLFSCDRDGRNWLYSDVEGYLCFIIDYQAKTKYLVIYDNRNFEKLFQFELYNNFTKYYEELAPEFRSFEIDSGFMGFQFESKDEAVEFDLIISRVSGLTNDLFSKPRAKEDLKLKEQIASTYCKKLKEMFSSDEKYDENYAEDGTTILKHNNFKILLNIEYDKEIKKFKFGKISEELKVMFMSFGIRKKDLENDADFAFTLFKKVIVGLGRENALKNTALDNIEHTFPPPEEREKIRREEEAAEAKMNSVKAKRNLQKRKETSTKGGKKPTPRPQPPKQKTSTKATPTQKQKGVPPPPPPPPPPQSVPGSVPKAVPKVVDNNAKQETAPPKQAISLEEELIQKRGNLKPPEKAAPAANDKMIQGSGKNFLQDALSTAIRNRRNNLRMHDDEDDDEEDDWD